MSSNLELLFLFGRPFGPLYAVVMKLRELLYRRGIFASHALPVPVISVGNIVLGGTGKTPAVQTIARHFQQKGWRPAIISRGYRGKSTEKVNIVSDFNTVFLSAQDAGDEPFMHATALPAVAVLTGARRIPPCRYAVESLGADVLLLDDGFQHLAVRRDIDLVLFDGTSLAGNSRIFPAGVLREPISALNRANGFIITGVNDANAERVQKFSQLLNDKFNNNNVFLARKSEYITKNINKCPEAPSISHKYYAFCGIANPERFLETLKNLHINPEGTFFLRDHAAYTQILIDKLSGKAKKTGVTRLITTEKDYVKLQQLSFDLPLDVIRIEAVLPPEFFEFLEKRINTARTGMVV